MHLEFKYKGISKKAFCKYLIIIGKKSKLLSKELILKIKKRNEIETTYMKNT